MNEFWKGLIGSSLIGAGGGNPAFAMQLVQQQKEKEAQRKAAEQLGQAFAPQPDPNFPSPTSPTDSAPTFGTKAGMPDIKTLAPLLLANPQFASPVLEMLKMMQPEQGAGFTLGEGQTRYGANGQAIASAPRAAPQESPFNLSPGQVRYGADGKQIAALPATAEASAFNLSPGQVRFGADGKQIASLPNAPNGQGESESWGQPSVEAGDDGKPVLVRYSNRGGRRLVEGATPAQTGVGQPTVDQAKANQLYTISSKQLPILIENFDALSGSVDQGKAGVNLSLTSAPYQRAYNSLTTIAASYIYSVSGQAAPPQEVAALAQTLMPRFGEAKESVADKRQRVKDMVESIKLRSSSPNAAGAPVSAAPVGGGSGGFKYLGTE